MSLTPFTSTQQAATEDWRGPALEIAYDGGARSGKTFLICCAIIQRALRYPGSRHLISRLRGNHLELTVWRQTFLPLLRLFAPGGQYKLDRVYRTVTFPNGSEIIGMALDDIERIEKILGTEFVTIFVNEAVQISYATYQTLKTRCVQNIEGLNNKIALDCNPSNQFHWIYRYFIQKLNPDNPEQKIKNADKVLRRGPWLPAGNNYLSATGQGILNSLSGTQYERMAKGLWVSAEGLVYPEYEGAVVEPFKLNAKNYVFEWVVDFGYTNPFATLFFALDLANETWYLFDEYYVRQKTVKTHCQALREFRSQWLDSFPSPEAITADHDAEDRATMQEEGLPTLAADKDIKTGIQALMDLMRATRGMKIRVFRTCTNTLSEFAGYKWPEHKKGTDADEKPVKGDDHCMDGLRYFAKRISVDNDIDLNLGRLR